MTALAPVSDRRRACRRCARAGDRLQPLGCDASDALRDAVARDADGGVRIRALDALAASRDPRALRRVR